MQLFFNSHLRVFNYSSLYISVARLLRSRQVIDMPELGLHVRTVALVGVLWHDACSVYSAHPTLKLGWHTL